MEDIVIVSAARTAVGKFGGSLAKIPAPELGAAVIKEAARARQGDAATRSAKSSWARCWPPAAGQNPARQAVIKARPAARSAGADDQRRLRLGPEGRDAGGAGHPRRRQRDRDRRRPGEHERRAARAAELARRPAHGRLEDGRHHDRRRPVGRLQPVPHGRHRRERGQEVRHHARASRTRWRWAASRRRRRRRKPAGSRTRSCRSPSRRRRATRSSSPPTSSSTARPTPKRWPACAPPSTRPARVTAGNASGLNDGAAAVVVMSAKTAEQLGLHAAGPHRQLRHRRAGPGHHGHGPGAGVAEGAAARRLEGRRTSTCSRSTRPSPRRPARSTRRWAGTRARSTSTAARSPSGTRSVRPAAASW